MSANWPWPPLWRLKRACWSTLLRMVSLYLTWGRWVLTGRLYLSLSRSAAIRRWISPWPQSTISWVSASWVTERDGSSSTSLARAAVSFTSSLRFSTASARENRGESGAVQGWARLALPDAESRRPVLTSSMRASATTSPTPALASLVISWPLGRATPPTLTPLSVMPSAILPESTRARDSLPLWDRW